MASRILSSLNGIFSAYKPAELSLAALKRTILKRIVTDGNSAVGWPKIPTIKLPIVEPHENSGALLVVGEKEQLDYRLHPLVCGEVFRVEDFRLEELHQLEASSSGVCVFAVNDYCDQIPSLLARSWVNEYRLEGMLGRETWKHKIKGRVTLKCDYDHVTRHQMLKLLAKIEANYRKTAFEAAGLDLQSEEAFEMARKGIPRSQLPDVPVVYKIELDTFRLPYFAVHLQISGENDNFLRCFVHELGVSLGTTASCVRLQRRAIGPFTGYHALLEKQISLQNIIRNVQFSKQLLSSTDNLSDVVEEGVCMEKDILPDTIVDGLGMHAHSEEVDHMRPAWPRNYD